MERTDLEEIVERADPAELLRAVDGLCAVRDWAGLETLRTLLTGAVERGRPLWPVITWVEYRTALEAPGEQAASVLRPGAGRFALGPLTEVAAATHTWAELADHLQPLTIAGSVAQERVLRGEDLRHDERAHPEVLELPLALASWEPAYALATYTFEGIEVDGPPDLPTTMVQVRGTGTGRELARPDARRALLDLVEVWTTESAGVARSLAITGDLAGALDALGVRGARAGEIDPADALAHMAWAAASGGAHGVRRGAALGRFDAWWAAAAITGTAWPADPDALGAAVAARRWWWWDEGTRDLGWVLRLGVSDPADGSTVVIDAVDRG